MCHITCCCPELTKLYPRHLECSLDYLEYVLLCCNSPLRSSLLRGVSRPISSAAVGVLVWQAMLQWKRQARAAPGVASFVATRQREQELFELGYQRVAGRVSRTHCCVTATGAAHHAPIKPAVPSPCLCYFS